jgi:asparagine N-glycosylation enzyme membrane subunit Stt3
MPWRPGWERETGLNGAALPFWLRSRFLQFVRGRERRDMLYTLAVILLIAWLLGVVGTYTIGAFVHVLLVVAIVLFLVGLLSGRRTVV